MFLMTYSLGEQTAMVLARLRRCAGSSESSLFASAINGNEDQKSTFPAFKSRNKK